MANIASIEVARYERLLWRKAMWIKMVKTQYVVITVQVDMNLIVVCERIMTLQPAKKMNLMMMMMNES